jgi:hypothetical protein
MGSSRLLFLDDDPRRAQAFLLKHPDAVWVTTADQCLEHLAECWDEVHLDHDLGGERWVDFNRGDTGMAIVGWLCRGPRPHLKATRFYVHTHNTNAACIMVLHLQVMGYDVRACPFGMGSPESSPREVTRDPWSLARQAIQRFRDLFGRRSVLSDVRSLTRGHNMPP